MKDKNDKQLVRYLLGELPDTEEERIEQRYFTDDHFLEQLELVEEELIDSYVRGELSEARRSQFEKYFQSSPERREKIEFAVTLLEVLQQESTSALSKEKRISGRRNLLSFSNLRPAMQIGFAVMVVLLIIVGGIRVKRELDQTSGEFETKLRQQAEAQRAQYDELLSRLEEETSLRQQVQQQLAKLQPLRFDILSFVLTPGLTRDIGDIKTLIIPNGNYILELQLDSEQESAYRNFRAALLTDEGAEAWSQGRFKAGRVDSGQGIFLRIPALVFSNNQNYILKLQGLNAATNTLESIDDYPFRVERR